MLQALVKFIIYAVFCIIRNPVHSGSKSGKLVWVPPGIRSQLGLVWFWRAHTHTQTHTHSLPEMKGLRSQESSPHSATSSGSSSGADTQLSRPVQCNQSLYLRYVYMIYNEISLSGNPHNKRVSINPSKRTCSSIRTNLIHVCIDGSCLL